jgi:uncharacterized protein
MPAFSVVEASPLSRKHLIIFARYPAAGKAKTRLIPALGPEGAAALYRQMAEHTLKQARLLQARLPSVSVEIQFAGGSAAQIRDWLGDDLQYQPQSEGDLGDRMAQACQSAFAAGARAAIVIGTDCPDLDADLLEKAFRELQHHDLVLGPASDGGYYLIGLRRSLPELFQGIAWSTATVLQRTVELGNRLGLSIGLLPTLSDVDYPADLAIWRRVTEADLPLISVIIPVLNEVDRLAATLATVQSGAKIEIIVVDGGSSDGTIALAQSLGVTVIAAPASRAAQMNAGASAAQGEILLFLHGDTGLPAQFDQQIRQAIAPPIVAGAFELAIASPGWGLRLVEWGVKVRSRLLQLPYGDQALFLKASTFRELGGFAALPIMEDFEFVQRLRTLGKIAIVPAPVLTSARRWQTIGVLKTTLLNQVIVLAYFLGISPSRIATWYRGQSPQSSQSAKPD